MKKKMMMGINVAMRSSAGIISTLSGIAVGKAVAKKHNTMAAVASAIGTAAIIHFISTSICDMIYKQMVKNNDEDCFVENVEEPFQDTHFSSDYDGDVDFISEFTHEIDKLGEFCVECSDEEIQENNKEDDAAAVTDSNEEDELLVEANALLITAGEEFINKLPNVQSGINENRLALYLDVILSNNNFYNVDICEDDGRKYLPEIYLKENIL